MTAVRTPMTISIGPASAPMVTPRVPANPTIAPMLDASLPTIKRTGPTAATTSPIIVIIFCVFGSSSLNLFSNSVIFCIIGVTIGNKNVPIEVAKSCTDAWNIFKLLAVPSFVLAKSPCASFVLSSTN